MASPAKTLCNWVDNTPAASATTHTLPVTSPATGAVIAHVPVSLPADVEAAVASASKAFESWSARTVKDRVQILIRFHQLVVAHTDELADLIVLEHGKTKQEAVAEIAKGNETVEYAISMPQLVAGRILEVSRGVTCSDSRRPLGVVVSIVPFNFPFMVPMWTLPIAIALGNTFILKPSEKVPLTMTRVMELLARAGLPAGVVNLVNGTAPVVHQLIDHADVRAVTFVGTSAVAESVSKRGRNLNKRVLALGGAKNHLVANPDCDIDMASTDIVASFTGCAGQRCMAASVLLTIGDQPELLASIVRKASAIVPGQHADPAVQPPAHIMGPVIDTASRDRILKYINESVSAGATLLLDGRSWLAGASPAAPSNGTYIGPTILHHHTASDAALHDEIFGPVLSVLTVPSRAAALAIETANPYGNAACIYTQSGAVAQWFAARFTAAMVGVNIGVPVPREPFSFGGMRASRFGDSDITGDGGIEFFSERRKVTTKWGVPAEASWMS
ncbi:Aldehyde/histidinol dehydrogenase [Entophlyctis helioformis]|nr:Aldehyde/histidinol dehydrogenase [Entophlyctis helioformis]